MLKKQLKRDYTYAVGRRKEAVARVRLYPHVKVDHKWGESAIKEGQLFVNEKPIEHYFSGPVAKTQYMYPFVLTKTEDKFTITAKISGGGLYGQLDAFIVGVSRALSSLDRAKFRPVLKKAGLLTRDARVRERRKVGTGGKARRKKQSPKR